MAARRPFLHVCSIPLMVLGVALLSVVSGCSLITNLDATPPEDVGDLRVTAQPGGFTASWTNPTDTDFSHAVLLYNSQTDAEKRFSGDVDPTGTTVVGLTPGDEYRVTVKSVDSAGNMSEGVASSVVPLDAPDAPVDLGDIAHEEYLYESAGTSGHLSYRTDAGAVGTATNLVVESVASRQEAIEVVVLVPEIDVQLEARFAWSTESGYVLTDMWACGISTNPICFYSFTDNTSATITWRSDQSIDTISVANTSEWSLVGLTDGSETGTFDEILTDVAIDINLNRLGYLAPALASTYTVDELRFADTRAYRDQANSSTVAALQSDPVTAFPDLVSQITAGVEDEGLKLKIIYDWIADYVHYDWDAYTSGERAVTAPYEVLPVRRTVCAGYARLLEEASKLAGVPVRYTTGGAKGYSYDPDAELPGHAWNFTQINGRFYLLDATWDSANRYEDGVYVDGDESWEFFLVPPDRFIHTHLPDSAYHQLLDSPISEAEFRADTDYIRGNSTYPYERFFDAGIGFAAAPASPIVTNEPMYELLIECDGRVALSGDADLAAFVDPSGDRWSVTTSFARGGEHQATLWTYDDAGGTSGGYPIARIGYFYTGSEAGPPLAHAWGKAYELGTDLTAPEATGFTVGTTSSVAVGGSGSYDIMYMRTYDAAGTSLQKIDLTPDSLQNAWCAELVPSAGAVNARIWGSTVGEVTVWALYDLPIVDAQPSAASRGVYITPSTFEREQRVWPEVPDDPRRRPTMPR